jgi:hypothetical protein
MNDIDSIVKKITTVTNNELNLINFNLLLPPQILTHDDSYEFLNLPSGQAHYKLLSFIVSLFNNSNIFDVGTNACRSAIALSTNKNNKVISYDVEQNLLINPILKNVEFILGDTIEDSRLKDTPFIMLDVNHDGLYEDIFYNFLRSINWKGILLLDDIHLNEPMKKFWSSIVEEKYDITNLGSWSGTGLVIFK